jgi:hypothetical protein
MDGCSNSLQTERCSAITDNFVVTSSCAEVWCVIGSAKGCGGVIGTRLCGSDAGADVWICPRACAGTWSLLRRIISAVRLG